MRHSFPRVSASVAAFAAFLTAFVLASPRDVDEGPRHSAVRAPRAAAQRLDAGDAIAHGFDESDPVLTPASEGLGDFTAAGSGRTGSSSPAVLPRLPLLGRPVSEALLADRPTRTSPPGPSHRPSRGRAPPSL